MSRLTSSAEAAPFDCGRESYLNYRLSENEVWQEFGLTVGFLRARRVRGGGPRFERAGRNIKYSRRAVIAWLEAGEASSTTEADARRAAHG